MRCSGPSVRPTFTQTIETIDALSIPVPACERKVGDWMSFVSENYNGHLNKDGSIDKRTTEAKRFREEGFENIEFAVRKHLKAIEDAKKAIRKVRREATVAEGRHYYTSPGWRRKMYRKFGTQTQKWQERAADVALTKGLNYMRRWTEGEGEGRTLYLKGIDYLLIYLKFGCKDDEKSFLMSLRQLYAMCKNDDEKFIRAIMRRDGRYIWICILEG